MELTSKRMRVFLGLRQADVAAATGVAVPRISGFENGRIRLNPTERRAIEHFYRDRAKIVAAAERGDK